MNTLADPWAAQRDLDREELRDVVTRIAADPSQWQSRAEFGSGPRHFEQLWRDDHLDVWVLSWVNGSDTGFHDHDRSHGAVAVVAGEVTEERLRLGGTPRRLQYRVGDVFDFDASHVHRICQDSDQPAVTIHAYSPPLERMGTYAVGSDGTLCRQSIPYAEELRPVAEAA